MTADDKVSEEPQRTRDVLLDMASQLLLAVIVGLVVAVGALWRGTTQGMGSGALDDAATTPRT